jgi:hypothetical protein
VAWWRFNLNAIAAFWFAYVVTRPLGASFADYISKAAELEWHRIWRRPDRGGVRPGCAVLVLYLAIARPDIQPAETAMIRSDQRQS